jgi:hypothetical protein
MLFVIGESERGWIFHLTRRGRFISPRFFGEKKFRFAYTVSFREGKPLPYDEQYYICRGGVPPPVRYPFGRGDSSPDIYFSA